MIRCKCCYDYVMMPYGGREPLQREVVVYKTEGWDNVDDIKKEDRVRATLCPGCVELVLGIMRGREWHGREFYYHYKRILKNRRVYHQTQEKKMRGDCEKRKALKIIKQ